jgi:hypothetical protein
MVALALTGVGVDTPPTVYDPLEPQLAVAMRTDSDRSTRQELIVRALGDESKDSIIDSR